MILLLSAGGSLPHFAEKTVEVGGYTIPKGSIVIAISYMSHVDPGVWGQDAEEFRPDRWLQEDGKLGPIKPEYTPFMIGQYFAWLPKLPHLCFVFT